MANETVRLAEYAAKLKFEDIPPDVIERAKHYVIDTVAAIVYGNALPWSRMIVAYAEKTGPGGRSRILGSTGPTVQAPAAALANGALAHAFEMDNLTKPGTGCHPGATLLAPALAVAQDEQRNITGRELLTALVAGTEVMLRIGHATLHSNEKRGFHAPGTTGPFGGAVAIGRMLGLIDKICVRDNRVGGDVSREGVQRDLLPLIEGTVVSTKHGSVKTDHILFIASGAFHISKPSDLLPELQGRLPIRVELAALTREDLKRILTEPEASLIKQYVALMATEGVTLDITDEAIDAIADIAVAVNGSVENIGARRLQTVMERVLDEISFTAPDKSGETVKIDAEYVRKGVGDLAKNTDLSRFIL